MLENDCCGAASEVSVFQEYWTGWECIAQKVEAPMLIGSCDSTTQCAEGSPIISEEKMDLSDRRARRKLRPLAVIQRGLAWIFDVLIAGVHLFRMLIAPRTSSRSSIWPT
jgi:hypothetical protein